MKARTRTLAGVMKSAIDARLRNLAKVSPGVVVSYDEETETCSVQVGVHRLVPSAVEEDLDEVEELPVIHSVPVAWPRARGYSLVGSLGAGDPVTLYATDRDMSAWRRSGEASEPDDARVHSWGSAIAVPGLQADVGGFDVPEDAAALASFVDLLVGIVKGSPAGTDAGWGAFRTAVTAAFGGVSGIPSVTVPYVGTPKTAESAGSVLLKLEE